jgi:hypothetical protein
VVVEKFGTSNKWIWDIEKFIDRKACMSEMYLEFKEHAKVNKEYDHFKNLKIESVFILFRLT